MQTEKNYVGKDLTLLLFFLSKSPCKHAISRQKHLELPVVLYLLIELFYFGSAVVRTDRLSGVRSRDYQNFSDGSDYDNFLIGKGARVELRF